MSFPRYPDYKDSGVEWLGEVPAHWRSVPLRFLANGPSGLFIDGDWIESKDIASSGIRYITTGNVGEGKYREQGEGFISNQTFADLSCTEVLTGDILISRLNAPIGRACIVPDLGCRIVTSVDNVIFRPDSVNDRRFLVYLMSSHEHFANTELLARGSTMQRISRSILGNVRFCIPSHQEQTNIADFLDHETAKIDALVAEQEKLIALLKEKRQAVISHAVTKGLNPDAPMKDSGVEWLLGEVPAHWAVAPMKYVVKLQSGGTPSKDRLDYWEGDIPWASAKDMKVDRLVDTEDHITAHAIEEGAAVTVPVGSVVVVVRGMILARIFPVALTMCEITINQDLKAIRCCDRLHSGFFAWYLRGTADESLCRLDEAGHGTKALRMDAWTSMEIALPPLTEQQEIAEFVEASCARFDALIGEAGNAMNLLKERRSALISAAVTGKIDVRGFADEKEAA